MGQVFDNLADFFGVWTCCLHSVFCFTHFTRGNHFHGARDLLSIFNTPNLCAYFFTNSHLKTLLPAMSFDESLDCSQHTLSYVIAKIACCINVVH